MMITKPTPPTLAELRNALANVHTAPLRVIPAERYERDLGAALGMLDRLTGELAPLPHCPPNVQELRCNEMTCRECWERWLDTLINEEVSGGETGA
jgi:hypothetical protein